MAEMAGDPTSHLFVVGVNERSAGTALHERLFAEEPDPAPLLSRLHTAGVGEAVVLATCERVELLAVADEAAAGETLLQALAEQTGIAVEEIQAQSFRREGLEALTHLFRVAASLDSQMVAGRRFSARSRTATAGPWRPAWSGRRSKIGRASCRERV